MASDNINGQPHGGLSIAGSKRKRESPKFYAVRIGRRPGVYNSWDECLAEVKGNKGAIYKSFSTKTDAESFVTAKDNATAGHVGSNKKWYGVQVGRNPGVYTSWFAAQDEITGFKGALFRSFATKDEAEAYIANKEVTPKDAQSLPKKVKTTKAKARDSLPPATSVDRADFAPGEAPLPVETEDGFDTAIVLDEQTGEARYRTHEERSKFKVQAARPSQNSAIAIYTDGSALANGQHGAMAGVGVFFGPGDKRNVSEGLSGTRQTNNRAELTAILRAVEMAPRDKRLIIYSDSNYAINCITKWYTTWRRNNWHNAAGKPVENRDLINKIIESLEERLRLNQNRLHDASQDQVNAGPWEKGPAGVKFVWVKGHAVDEGNIAADELATSGAREARQLHEDIDV